MSSERALADPAEGSSRAAEVREVLRLLVKAQKANRLYEGRNQVSERLESDLFSRLSALLDEHGEFHLVVQEFSLRCDDELVYRSENRSDSLAFLLFRDGVRRLSFHRGLELAELRAFLRCLNRVAVLANDQDDLVTLLWEQELHAIRYFAIEELESPDDYPRLQDQLASGEVGSSGGGAGGEGVSLDLEQPVSTVPVEACRLADEEIEALQEELAREERVPFHQVVSELALELTLLEDGEEEQAEVRENVLAIADRLVDDGDLLELIGLTEHLDGLATMVFASDLAIQRLTSDLRRALAEPDRMERCLERVDRLHVPKPEVLTAYLARLGPHVAPSLVRWMGRFASPVYRRAVTNALLVSEDGGLSALEASLPLGLAPEAPPESLHHRQLVREMLHAFSQHPGERALAPLERLLGAADVETRRESFLALSRYPIPRVRELCLERLNDLDPEIRATALDTLVRHGKSAPTGEILERALDDPGFVERSLTEKRRLFAAVAKLGGDDVLPRFEELIKKKGDRWFTSPKEKRLAEAVAHGVRVVGTPRAKELLKRCAREGARFARAACLKELEKMGESS